MLEGKILHDPEGYVIDIFSRLQEYHSYGDDVRRFRGILDDVEVGIGDDSSLNYYHMHALFVIASGVS